MKKLLAIILPAVLALTACQKQSAFNEEEFLNEIKPNIECLKSCEEEMFGADVDFDTSYFSAFADEDSYDGGVERGFCFSHLKMNRSTPNSII